MEKLTSNSWPLTYALLIDILHAIREGIIVGKIFNPFLPASIPKQPLHFHDIKSTFDDILWGKASFVKYFKKCEIKPTLGIPLIFFNFMLFFLSDFHRYQSIHLDILQGGISMDGLNYSFPLLWPGWVNPLMLRAPLKTSIRRSAQLSK